VRRGTVRSNRHHTRGVRGGLARAALLAALLGGDRASQRAQAALHPAVRLERVGKLAEEAGEVRRAPGPEVARGRGGRRGPRAGRGGAAPPPRRGGGGAPPRAGGGGGGGGPGGGGPRPP